MAGILSSSSHLILHHIPRPKTPTRPSSSSFLSFFLFKQFTAIRLPTTPLRSISSSSTSHSSRPLFCPSPALSLSSSLPPPHPFPNSLSNSQQTLEPENQDACEGTHDDEEVETGDEDFELDVEEMVSDSTERAFNSSLSTRGKESASELPSLTVKEKKELASYAHSLGKKLKSQQVGKSGVTDSVAAALIETLEANELLKLKIHGSCPGELEDVVKQLEEATGSVVVGQIGRTVILYRPSLTKLQAEEKKKQAQRVFRRKQPTLKPSFENKGQPPEPFGRGRRGSSRFFRSP